MGTTEQHVFSNRKEVRQQVMALAGQAVGAISGMTQEEADKPHTLNQKIALISQAVKEMKRKGKNADQGYPYLKIEDAVNAVRPLLEIHGLLLTGDLVSVETVPDSKGITFKVEMLWMLEDLQTGDKRFWRFPGAGWDYHDKGLYKAITGSRKYAHIVIFNLPVGDNPESAGPMDRGSAKTAQKNVAASKLADAAGRGVKEAVEQMSQIEPEKKIIISRPEEHHGNYIIVTGYLAAPQLERFFDDTDSKRFKTKKDLVPYWRVPADYEKGLIALCQKIGVEVEG